MQAVTIKEGIYWVGALDPNLRVFDIVMETKHGTTYNAYLVKGEKTALIETVKAPFGSQLMNRLESVVPPEAIDYVVFNHTEPDHSGALGSLLAEMPDAKVVGSRVAIKFLSQQLNRDFEHIVVGDGDEIDLGGKTLRFVSAPFLHWPDTMFTYVPEDKVLFTCDAFGTHHCNDKIFNDLVGDISGDFKYYFDMIVSPFKEYVLEAVSKVKDFEIDVIAPSHGPVLRHNPMGYVDTYVRWSTKAPSDRSRKKVAVIYTTAYGNTAVMAEEITLGLFDGGVEAELLEIGSASYSFLVEKIEASDGFIIGSPTINRDAVFPVWELLARVSVITNKGKPVAAFGCYGWSGEAVKLIEQRLTGLQCKVVLPGIRVNFAPDSESLEESRNFGRSFAEIIRS